MPNPIKIPTPTNAPRELRYSRIIDAPVDLLFRDWTDPNHLASWFGPNGFTLTTHQMDVRPGGTWVYTMHGPDGTNYPNRIVYEEVTPPRRLVYNQSGDGDTAHIHFHVSVEFEDLDGKSRLVMCTTFDTPEELAHVINNYNADEGGRQTIQRLAEHLATVANRPVKGATITLPSDRELIISRVFRAPRNLVFEALTRPEHVRNWYGCHTMKMLECNIDLRLGGAWRYVLEDSASDSQFAFSGVYREVDPPSRLVSTECFEAMPDHDYLVTVTLAEDEGVTTLRSHLLYKCPEDRDGHLASGMEGGMNETFDRLADLLNAMKPN